MPNSHRPPGKTVLSGGRANSVHTATPDATEQSCLCRVWRRHGTGSHFVTQRPSDPGIQRPGDPVDPVTVFYNELQMSTYVADKRLQWARGLPVFIAVWRLHASGK